MQLVKDLVLSLQWFGSLVWCRLDPWPRNFTMLRIQPKHTPAYIHTHQHVHACTHTHTHTHNERASNTYQNFFSQSDKKEVLARMWRKSKSGTVVVGI